MENFWEKMERKTFLKCVWLGREERKKMVGPGCFLSRPRKKFSPKNGDKTIRRKWDCLMDENAHVHLHIASANFFFFSFSRLIALPILFFLFFFPWHFTSTNFFFSSFPRCVASPNFLFSFFLFLSWTLPSSFFFGFLELWVWYIYIYCLTRHDFYFLINWVIAFFFWLFNCHIFVLVGHHFLTRVYE